MYYVYVIRSITFPAEIYIGATADLKQRFADHNAGRSVHTSKFRPWTLECYMGFLEKEKAYDFEKYLKSHSGRAFTHKRLLQDIETRQIGASRENKR
ncbi:MAG: excinuclease subunit [Rickettsiales bacterium]|jgi:predicted GIY-YIG superfamily endonuclease|nr:excinuclease subunit [Rickettsiales bacterium]